MGHLVPSVPVNSDQADLLLTFTGKPCTAP